MEPSTRSRRRRRGCLLLALAAAAAGLLLHAPLLRAAANLWIVSPERTETDVIVLLGGQIATRPAKAAELYREGRAPIVLVMREAHHPILHQTEERSEEVASLLRNSGVPAEAIAFSIGKVSDTRGEAAEFEAWIRSRTTRPSPRRATVVTDAFHSRRALLVFKRQLPGLHIQMATVPHRKYTAEEWWKSNFGIRDFLSEILKTLGELFVSSGSWKLFSFRYGFYGK